MEDPTPNLGGLSSQEREIIGKLRRDGATTINNQSLLQRFQLSRSYANQILLRLEKKGWLQRVARGRYILVDLSSTSKNPIAEDALVLAMDLFSPCYLTGWTAAEHWGMTEQIFNSVLVHTAKYQRASEKNVAGVNFVIRRIEEAEIFGTKTIWSSNQKIVFADQHRTIIDILDRPEDGGSAILVFEICREYLRSKDFNAKQLLQYATRINKGSVFKRLGFLADHFIPDQQELVNICQQNISKGISLFDPSGPKKGRIQTKWNLQINIPFGDDNK